MRLLIFLFFFVSSLSFLHAKKSYEGNSVIRINLKNESQFELIKNLIKLDSPSLDFIEFAPHNTAAFQKDKNDDDEEDLDFWKEPTKDDGHADVRIPSRHLQALEEQGMNFDVMIRDLQDAIQQEENELNRRKIFEANFKPENLTLNEYHNLEEIYAYLNSVAVNNPKVAKIIQIGRTFEGRKILGLRVRPSGEWKQKLPTIFVHGLIHSREWVTGAAVLDLIDKIVVKKLLPRTMSKLEFYFVPVLNPDGYAYTWSRDRLWRKTRSGPVLSSNFRSCYGADANRNFGFQWSGKFSNSDPCAEDFRGVGPFSEIEVFSLARFLNTIKFTLKGYIDLHAYGKFFVYPYAFSRDVKPQEMEKMDKVARQAVANINSLPSDRLAPYTSGPVAKTIYFANGATIDYVKGVLNVTYAYALELGPGQNSGRNGFLLPRAKILETVQESSIGLFTVFGVIARGE